MIKTAITNCFVERTTCFTTQDNGGSCFIYDYKEKQFLLTARHIFKPNFEEKCQIKIYNRITNNFENYDVKVHYNKQKDDVAIVELPEGIKVTNETASPKLAQGPFIWGEDAYILGFPAILGTNFMQSINNTKRAFFKKAVLSGQIDNIIYLDGYNNAGFSGGPICYVDLEKNEFLLIGIVNGYCPEISEIKKLNDIKTTNIVKAPASKEICAVTNSGIMYGTCIKAIIDLIEEIN